MEKFKGLYIGNMVDNQLYTKLFALDGIKIECLDELPKRLDGIYDIVLENDVDFLLIDSFLGDAVEYAGIDVLREIRKFDSNIYAIELSGENSEWDFDIFVEFDYELKKSLVVERYIGVAKKIKRACSLRDDNSIFNLMSEKERKEFEQLKLLKEISSQLDAKG